MDVKHTPMPWSGGHYSSIVGCPVVGRDGQVICNTAIGPKPHKESAEANAAFIVRACNAYEDVLVALRCARDELVSLNNNHLSGAAAVVRALVTKQIERCNGAIAKAECK